MPLLQPDDDAARLRGPWLGPDASVRWPVDWTFQEWGAFLAVTATAWIVTVPFVWSAWGLLGSEKLEQLLFTLVPTGPFGLWLGWLAKEQVAPIVNSDRRLSWLIAGWVATAKQLWWAHGPADRQMLTAAACTWIVSIPFAGRLPGPTLLWLPASAFACIQGARWVRDRVESPNRHRERTWARLDRSVGPVACITEMTTAVEVRPDSCIPRDRYPLRLRFRFLSDLAAIVSPRGSST